MSGAAGPATAAEVAGSTEQTASLAFPNEKIQFENFGIFAGLSGPQRRVTLSTGAVAGDYVAALNGHAQIGARVTASLVGGRLTITSDTTGASEQFQVSSNRAAAANTSGIGTSTIQGDGADASAGGGMDLQIGTHTTDNDRLTITLDSVLPGDLGLTGSSTASAASAQNAIGELDAALGIVSSQRASVGAYSNALSHATSTLLTLDHNMRAAVSSMRDLDMAEASSQFALRDARRNASAALLAQANANPRLALSLLSSAKR